MDGTSYYVTCLYLYLFVQRTSIVRTFLRREREIWKAIAVGLLHFHTTVNSYGDTMKMVARVIVQRNQKKKVTYTHK